MGFLKRLTLIAIIWLLLVHPAHAQEDLLLAPLSRIISYLDVGESERWQLPALTGSVLTFHLRARSGDLDPTLRIIDEMGRQILHSSDVTHPLPLQVLIEAFTMPHSAVYTIEVSSTSTSGDYELDVLPGFAILNSLNIADSGAWSSSTPDQLIFSPDRLTLITDADQPAAFAHPSRSNFGDRSYAFVEVDTNSSDEPWIVSMTVGYDDETFHSFNVNHEGFWRFTLFQGGQTETLKTWRAHPAIIAGVGIFNLGILFNQGHFDLYYNGQYIDSVWDERNSVTGIPGILVGYPNDLVSNNRIHITRFAVTTPATPAAEPERLRFIPTTLSADLRALQQVALVPPILDNTFLIPEANWQSVAAGVSLFPISNEIFEDDFIFSTTVSWETESRKEAGCGLAFAIQNDAEYGLAFLDTGGLGLTSRHGDVFENHAFDLASNDPMNSHHFLIHSQAGVVSYYLDGRFLGKMTNATEAGSVAFAVLNYEDSFTACRFRETSHWVWD